MSKGAYVYAIEHPGGYVKLGHSECPESRLSQHQTGTPHELRLIGKVPVYDPAAVESSLHDVFSDRHVRGEWYEFDSGEYYQIFDWAKSLSKCFDTNGEPVHNNPLAGVVFGELA